jgi:hypothetical protein
MVLTFGSRIIITRTDGRLCFDTTLFVNRQKIKITSKLGIFLFTTASRTPLGLTLPSIQWVPGALSLGVKRPEREADYSPPSSVEVKECVELYLYSPSTPSWRGAQFKQSTRTTLPFTFTISKLCWFT